MCLRQVLRRAVGAERFLRSHTHTGGLEFKGRQELWTEALRAMRPQGAGWEAVASPAHIPDHVPGADELPGLHCDARTVRPSSLPWVVMSSRMARPQRRATFDS